MADLADRIPEIPSFWLIAALSLAALAADLLILLVSRARLARQKSARRRAEGGDWQAIAALKAPSRLPEIIAVLMPLAVAVTATVASLYAARHAARISPIEAMSEKE